MTWAGRTSGANASLPTCTACVLVLHQPLGLMGRCLCYLAGRLSGGWEVLRCLRSMLGEQPKTGDVPGATLLGVSYCCCRRLCGSVRTEGACCGQQLCMCLTGACAAAAAVRALGAPSRH